MIHNLIRKDRYTETRFIEEKSQLQIKGNGSYTEAIRQLGIPNGNQMATQVRLGKVRLEKKENVAAKPQRTVKKNKYGEETPMNLKEFLKWMEESPHRHINLIGDWAEAVEADFKTKGQWRAFTDQNLKYANQMKGFDDEQIQIAFDRMLAEAKEIGFTPANMSTLLKYIIKPKTK